VTSNDFRRLALSFPEVVESSHMDHPDFRVGGKVFATLGYPDPSWAMIKLAPVEQQMFVKAEPKVFAPVKGGWGRKGATNIILKPAKKTSVRRALAAAWSMTAPKKLAAEFRAKS
jgi:hypothetical protein